MYVVCSYLRKNVRRYVYYAVSLDCMYVKFW